jgi:CBS domain-containing protein
MKVRDVMTAEPRTCPPDASVAAAAKQMLDGDCGILPVVDGGRLLGVVSDRDLFIALATRDRRASELTLGEVVQSPVWTCGPEDDVHAALARMKEHQVRRLPVTGPGGKVVGIVSMNDLLLATAARKPVHEADVLDTLQTISAHHHPEPHHAGA